MRLHTDRHDVMTVRQTNRPERMTSALAEVICKIINIESYIC